MDLDLSVNREILDHLLVVPGCPVGVDSVLEDNHLASSDKAQIEDEVTGIPTGKRTDIPVITLATGDGDFLTSDTLWDFKVLKKSPQSKHTLQILMYWIMGQHSGQAIFNGINKIGIYNPRSNTAYTLDVSKIHSDTISAIEKEVICYS